MTGILRVLAIWVVAVAAITVAFATERIELPELWLWPTTLIATCFACYFAPKHRWRWLIASPLIGAVAAFIVPIVVLGALARHSHAQAQAWLEGQFSGKAAPDPAQTPALYDIAAGYGGFADAACYENIPFAWLGWECRVSFRNGKSLTLDAWATWSRTFARTNGQLDGVRNARVVSPAGWVSAYVDEYRDGPSGGMTQVILSFDNDTCGAGAVAAPGFDLGLRLRWTDPTTLEVIHPQNLAMRRNASGEYLQCGPRKVHVVLTPG
jgi:hypothetical protein